MAEKADKKSESAEKKESAKSAAPAAAEKTDAAPEGGKGGIGALLTKTPVLIGGVMLLEAIVLFGGFKFVFGNPKSANADLVNEVKKDAEGDKATDAADKDKSMELTVLDAKFPNRVSGRTFLYDVSIAVEVKSEFSDKVKKGIADHDALIQDRVRTIIAQLDPEKLGGGSEPGLETLRRQVKYQLDEIIGDGMIDEVLVPKCLSFRTDY
jgi:flagellar basal body-associated protein FliL